MAGQEVEEADTSRVRFLDLGPLVVEVGGSMRALSARPATALAALLVSANRRVAVDTLMAAVWHDGRPRAISTLELHLWRLRQVLEPDRRPGEAWSVLVTEPGGYRLVVAADQADSLWFAELVEEAGTLLDDGEPARALHLLEQARGRWRGRPFAPVADQLWAAPTVARLEELRYQLDERHVDALLALGRPEQALVELGSALGDHPLRERLWARRMLASYRAGRVDDALAAYGDARSRFLDELGTEPTEELRDLQRRILDADPTLRPDRSAVAPTGTETDTTSLPRWSSRLVGRDHELERLAGLVAPSRLVTLCGPAGVGKTRLAVETAHRVAETFPDGVWFVDLSGARDTGQILDAISTVIGLAASPVGSPLDALQALVRGRRSLLLLDDCEHVLAAVVGLVELLCRACPELGLLVTSRERLALDGEAVVEVVPLVVPDEERPEGAALDLFLDRWESDIGPTDPDGLDDARRICRAVDGIPLALELAAARARMFSLAEVAEQAEQDPGALSRFGRRREAGATVYAAVDRSHRLLDDDERLLHRRLAVLPGRFTVSAAAAVAQLDGAAAADLLADLTHRSLVVARGPSSPGRPSSFAQLTIVRAHAARCADVEEETEVTRDRRDAWIARTVSVPRPRLGTPTDLARSRALDDDRAALRSTLQRSLVERPSGRGVVVVAELGALFWFQHDAIAEGARWIELAHGLAEGGVPGTDRITRLQLTIALASARAFARRVDLAAPLADRALDELLAGDLDPARELPVGDAAVVLSTCLGLAGDAERARRTLEVADAIAARTADPTLALLCRIRARMAELGRRPPGEVVRELDAAHRDALAVDNWFGAWVSSAVAQMAAMAAGDAETALSWSDACLAVVHRTGRRQAPLQLELRANTLALLGRHEEALRVYGVARSQVDRAGLPWPTTPGTEALLAHTRAAVPQEVAERVGRGVGRLTVRDLLGTPAARG